MKLDQPFRLYALRWPATGEWWGCSHSGWHCWAKEETPKFQPKFYQSRENAVKATRATSHEADKWAAVEIVEFDCAPVAKA